MKRSTPAFAVLAFVAGCPEPPAPVRCGPGTRLEGGACLAVASPDDARCGTGTVFDADTLSCVPFVECGDGTFEDEATGACLPLVACGENTFYNPATDSCVAEASCAPGTIANEARRLCESPLECGAGTALDESSRECRPLPPCTDGSELDPVSGLCIGSDLVCGPGQVGTADGRCVEPAEGLALEADVVEGVRQNDPALGGVPENVALEPLGERAVFVGFIDRPQDYNGDGSTDQDRDAFAFDAQAGDYLRVRVLGLGLTGPAFIVEGPRGYSRTSAVGVEPEADREILLPYGGRYRIIVVPGAFLATSVPAGDITARYVGVIERRPLPALQNVAPDTTLTGDLFDLDDNFFRIGATQQTALELVFRNVSLGNAEPAVVALIDDGVALRPLAHVQGIRDDGFAGIYVPDVDGVAFFAIDWRSADGLADDFTVDVRDVPLVESGVLPSDITIETAPVDIPGHQTAAFQLVLDEAQLIEVDVLQSFDPDVQVVGPSGTRVIIDDEDLFFFFAEAGEYVVFVNNDSVSDDDNAALALTLFSPYDLGGGAVLAPGDATTMTGPNLLDARGGPNEAWAIARVPRDSMLSLAVGAVAGDPDLLVFDEDGAPLRGLNRPQVKGALHVENQEARTLLVALDANAGTNELDNLVSWSLNAALAPLPPIVEVEPNDSHERATDLGVVGAAGVVVRGRLGPKQTDLYLVEAGALAPGEALRVRFDDLGVSGAGSTVSDGTSVMIYDELRRPLPSIPFDIAATTVAGEQIEVREGTLGPNTVTFIPAYEGQGPFFIELFKLFDDSDSGYVLAIDIVAQQIEVEPNDEPADADVLALPASIVGWRSTDDLVDLFSFTLDAADLASGAGLVVEWENHESNNDLTVALERDGLVVASQVRTLGALVVTHEALAAGEYLVRVTGAAALEPAYRVRVRLDAAIEREPNNDIAAATVLGVLGDDNAGARAQLEAYGEGSDVDVDVFTFTLAAPLGAEEGLRIEALNAADTTNLTAELWGSAGNVVARNTFDGAVLASAPAGTGPFYVAVSGAAGDRYAVRVAKGLRAEREPNNDQQTPTVLSTLPVSLEGNLHAGDIDVFRLEIAESVNVNAAFANLTDTTPLKIELRLENFTLFGESSSDDGHLAGIFLPQGTYYLVISQDGANSTGDHYRLVAEVAP